MLVLESMGSPDPLRVKYREALNEAVGQVVRGRKVLDDALASLGLSTEDVPKFQQMLVQELNALADFNCARYRLGLTSSPTLAKGHRLRGKEGDSYGAKHELPHA